MSSLSIEARVGAFVLVAIAVLSGFVLVLGDFSLGSGFRLYADFAYTGNLQNGAPVKVSGLKVGRVTDVRLLVPGADPPRAAASFDLGQSDPPVVRLAMALDPPVLPALTDQARFAIGTQGFIGDAYVELSPGVGGAPLREHAAVRGVDAPQLHVLAQQLGRVVQALSVLAGAAPTGGTVAAGEGAGGALGTLAAVLHEHKGELGRAVTDLAGAARELRGILASVQEALAAGRLATLLDDASTSAALTRVELPVLLARANAALAALDSLSTKAASAVDDQAVGAILADARRAAQNFEALSQDGRGVMSRIARCDGSLGALAKDPQIYDDLKDVVRELKRNPWKLFWRE